MKDRKVCSHANVSIDSCLNKSYAKRTKELLQSIVKLIQVRIDNIHTNPNAVLALSKELKQPLLYLYIAYSYNTGLFGKVDFDKAGIEYKKALSLFIKKIPIKEATKSSSSLSHKFMETLYEYEYSNDIDESIINDIKSTYKDSQIEGITTFIFALHFTKQSKQCIPNYAIVEDWKGSWIGTYGGYSSIFILNEYCDIPNEKKIQDLKYFSVLNNILSDMYGNPGVHVCTGTIEYASMASRNQSYKIANLNPLLFEKITSSKDIYNHLKIWSSYGIWNYYTHKNFKNTLPLALEELSNHYLKYYKMTDKEVKERSKIVIDNFLEHYTGSFSKGEYGPLGLLEDPVMKIFLKKKVTILDIDKLEGLQQEQLDKLLKYMLLRNSSQPLIEYIIRKGARINHGQESALFYALGNSKNVKLLIKKYGAKVNYTNCFGKTPLFSAIQIQNLDSIKVLLENGANVNHFTKSVQGYSKSCDGKCLNISVSDRTPLMYALWQGNEEIVTLLISKGANSSSVDSNGNGIEYYINKNNSITEVDKNNIHNLFYSKDTLKNQNKGQL